MFLQYRWKEDRLDFKNTPYLSCSLLFRVCCKRTYTWKWNRSGVIEETSFENVDISQFICKNRIHNIPSNMFKFKHEEIKATCGYTACFIPSLWWDRLPHLLQLQQRRRLEKQCSVELSTSPFWVFCLSFRPLVSHKTQIRFGPNSERKRFSSATTAGSLFICGPAWIGWYCIVSVWLLKSTGTVAVPTCTEVSAFCAITAIVQARCM